MLELTDDYIGYALQRHEMFSGSDDLETFNKNLISQPTDWYYANNPIAYQRNRFGHRCKNIEDIDLNNYFLAVGCSITEGIGLHVEDTYPYILSQELNCDYYNLGLGGTGIDVVAYNLLTWLGKVEQKPKFIIIQQPNENRFSTKEGPYINSHGIWSPKPEFSEFLLLGVQNNYFSTRYKLLNLLIKNTSTVPIIDVVKDLLVHETLNPCIFINAIDLARDKIHPGKETNKNIALGILEKTQPLL
jgi:hypothetical protein